MPPRPRLKTLKIAQRAQSDPLLYEILRDLGRGIVDLGRWVLALFAERVRGTPGYLAKFDTAESITDSMVYESGGDLYIGTAVRVRSDQDVEFAGGFKGFRAKDLTESVATGFVDLSVALNEVLAGECLYAVEASGGGGLQCRTGRLRFVALNRLGTVTASINEVGTQEIVTGSPSTLTVVNTILAGAGKVTLECNATSSLAQTTLVIRYRVDVLSTATLITSL